MENRGGIEALREHKRALVAMLRRSMRKPQDVAICHAERVLPANPRGSRAPAKHLSLQRHEQRVCSPALVAAIHQRNISL